MNNCPRVLEVNDAYRIVFPHEARIRNLTYATELYLDVRMEKREMYDPSGTQGLKRSIADLKEKKCTKFD